MQILKLNEDQWRYLGMLLEKGYPIKDALLVMDVLTPSIIERLESGEAITKLLLFHQKGVFYDHLHFFFNRLPLSSAIQTSLAYASFEKNLKKELFQKSAYPIVIFGLAVIALMVFRIAILPMMLSGFSLKQDTGMMLFLLNVLYQFAWILLLAVMLVVCYLSMHRLIPNIHLRLMKQVILHVPWAKDYLSYQFCGYLHVLIQEGISTKEVLLFLSQYCKQVLIAECADAIAQQLEKGVAFQEAFANTAFLSKRLLSIIAIGKAVSSFDILLLDFIEQQQSLMKKRMKFISVLIITIAYSYVAVLVITVYQIMLLPLSLLEQF